MFSSYNHLKRKTPDNGINRQEFIEHLVEEYYTTTNVEAQEQVTANLANFAYDPINWEFLQASEATRLFIELLETPNEKLQEHGSAGLSNICLDIHVQVYITKAANINIIKTLLLKTLCLNVIINILTLFYQLLSTKKIPRKNILCPLVLKRLKYFQSIYKKDQRIINICSLLLEEFGKRYEVVEINTNISLNDKQTESFE